MSTLLRPIAPTPLEQSLPLLESFVSPYTGIVRALIEFAYAPDEARLVSYGAVVAEMLELGDDRPTGESGGSHWVPEAARAAAIGESLERYSASLAPTQALVLATARELGEEAVAPESFALFHRQQYAADRFPFRPFGRESRVRWVQGVSLPTCRPAWLPAQLVYLPVGPTDDAEDFIGYTTSSGVACAPTPEEATLSALFELIERDAFMLTWSNRLVLPLLDWSADERLSLLEARYFAPAGLRYSVVDLSAFFGLPAALGVVHGTAGEVGALGVGAGCGTTVEVAWRKALAEAFAVHTHVRDALYEHPELLDRESTEIGSFADHIFYYGSIERATAAAFLDSSTERRPTGEVSDVPDGDLRRQIEHVTARLAAAGVDAYAVDVTSSELSDAGLSVMRVVCPQLCALDVVDKARFLGGTRLYQAAFRAGLAERPFRLDELNPHPHPFP